MLIPSPPTRRPLPRRRLRALSRPGLHLRRGLRWKAAIASAACVFAFSVQAQSADKAGAKPDTWYAQRVSEGQGTYRITHLWSSGRHFRSETIVNGHPIVTIVNGDTYYTLDLLTGKGAAIGRAQSALEDDARGGRPFATEFDVLMASGGEKVGPDAKLGCDLYRRTNVAGRVELCMSREDEPVPVYREVFDRALVHDERTTYVAWLRGFEVAESFFEPPPQIDLERLDYASYRKRSLVASVGPAPPLFADLLHGTPR